MNTLLKSDNFLRGNCTPKSKVILFNELSQNYQHMCFENDMIILKQIVWKTQIWNLYLSRLSDSWIITQGAKLYVCWQTDMTSYKNVSYVD